MRRHLMVSERISSCTCTGTWCYINRSSRVLAQTLEVNYRIFFCTCRLSQTLGATLKDLSLVLAQTLDDMLQDATCWARVWGTMLLGGVAGRQPGPYMHGALPGA